MLKGTLTLNWKDIKLVLLWWFDWILKTTAAYRLKSIIKENWDQKFTK